MMMRTMAMAMMKMVDMAIIRAVARCPWPESSAGIRKRRINIFKGPPSKPQHSAEDPVTGMLPGVILDPRTWPSRCALVARLLLHCQVGSCVLDWEDQDAKPRGHSWGAYSWLDYSEILRER